MWQMNCGCCCWRRVNYVFGVCWLNEVERNYSLVIHLAYRHFKMTASNQVESIHNWSLKLKHRRRRKTRFFFIRKMKKTNKQREKKKLWSNLCRGSWSVQDDSCTLETRLTKQVDHAVATGYLRHNVCLCVALHSCDISTTEEHNE